MSAGISERVRDLAARAMEELGPRFAEIDAVSERNTEKVLTAFRENRVSDACFGGTTGYGYDDKGREILERVYADVFRGEAALVRTGFASGTHAITCALFGQLRPGDRLLYASGLPYDTLQAAIGIRGSGRGSFKEYGIEYGQVDLTPEGRPDHRAIAEAASAENVSVVGIQRSRGYSERDALSIEDIGDMCDTIHRANPRAAVIVDNCYGEFTGLTEPLEAGADMIVGSLIKNPGGGLAPSGGYIVGRRDLVENASYRLTAPGIGGEVGATLGQSRLLFQGFFMAPHTTAQAMKTAVFCAKMMELMGFRSSPAWDAKRSDIIQIVELGSEEAMSRFCRGVQLGAPVDSFVTPVAGDMPGYECPVIMAAGSFIQGASIELSADGPMEPPYRVYLQGGLTFESGKLGIMLAAEELLKG